jgi:hypothetical protein
MEYNLKDFYALYSQQDKPVNFTFFLNYKILPLEQDEKNPLGVPMLYHCHQLWLCLTNDLIIFFPLTSNLSPSPELADFLTPN